MLFKNSKTYTRRLFQAFSLDSNIKMLPAPSSFAILFYSSETTIASLKWTERVTVWLTAPVDSECWALRLYLHHRTPWPHILAQEKIPLLSRQPFFIDEFLKNIWLWLYTPPLQPLTPWCLELQATPPFITGWTWPVSHTLVTADPLEHHNLIPWSCPRHLDGPLLS